MSTDIVIATHNRFDLLKRTIGHLGARTRTPYRLHVIDDGSRDETPEFLYWLRAQGIVASIWRRAYRHGIAANLRELLSVAESDPLVYLDDDVLCPDVEPDWLSRMLTEMASRPSLGILGLNNPQAHPKVNGDSRRISHSDGEVTFCRNVGGFVMLRRAVLEAVGIPDGLQSPLKSLCIQAGAAGFGVGYLTRTYCQHIGAVSVRQGCDWSAELALVTPLDDKTLEPPEAYRG
jgi:GT2 family glycosyltransferase